MLPEKLQENQSVPMNTNTLSLFQSNTYVHPPVNSPEYISVKTVLEAATKPQTMDLIGQSNAIATAEQLPEIGDGHDPLSTLNNSDKNVCFTPMQPKGEEALSGKDP